MTTCHCMSVRKRDKRHEGTQKALTYLMMGHWDTFQDPTMEVEALEEGDEQKKVR